ncbi:MAG: DUF4390 domain-containing protein [Rhizobacter sp.]|nr:DUF4390 domain-containing protein [Rhizobacter sp.]MBP6269541.1 DUF4390 domain-containing protein [Rhizobacter sp.]
MFARFLSLWATCLLALTLWIGSLPARAETPAPELSQFAVSRNEEGLLLDFAVRFDLPHSVEDALLKGVPLHFVADASLFRERWYWRDQRVNRVTRTWRLAYQPLTRTYRVSFGGLNQSFDSLADAVASVRRMGRWKLTEPGQIEEGEQYYVEFSYKLDTTLLPRPMQIGIGGQPDWTLQLEKTQRVTTP